MEFSFEYFCDRRLIRGKSLQKLWPFGELHNCYSIAIVNAGNKSQRNRARNICILQTELIPGIEQQEHVNRQALNAANLLRDAVLKDEHVIYYQGWIIVSILIESYYRQAHLFGEYTNGLLIFGFNCNLGSW